MHGEEFLARAACIDVLYTHPEMDCLALTVLLHLSIGGEPMRMHTGRRGAAQG